MTIPLVEVVRPGQVVGGYRVEKKLGAGGFGQVYLAHREGAACALKFLNLQHVGDWGWRELVILMSHDLPHVVKLRGHFKWPEDKPESLVLVMEYVPGVTLFQWARGRNPSAREVVEKLLPLTRALGGVHAAGVLHRDLKGDNVLVREPDGQPVLVDFGAGALSHAPPATREGMAPGNLRYRAPEAIAFLLRPVRQRGERYAYGVKDEMYALGVLLYVLLTDVYPFDDPDDELLGEIMAGETAPPCEVEARVPPPLSALCMRLLAKEPQARVPSAEALCTLLEALLRQAQGDPRWDVPLCDDWTEQGRTTEPVPELGDSAQAPLRRWMQRRPRRGPPPRPALRPESPTERAVRPGHGRRWGLLLGLSVAVGLVGVGRNPRLGLFVESSRERASPAASPRAQAPVPSLDAGLTSWAASSHEVAPPWKPPEAKAGAAPVRANTPVPVTAVTLRTEASRMKKSLRSPVLLAATAAANVACPSAPVRPETVRQAPPPQACPPGAVETMTRQLGLAMDEIHGADMPGATPNVFKYLPVKEGSASLVLTGHWLQPPYDRRVGENVGPIALPHDTRLLGQLSFGEKRVYGRITQAVTPAGDTFPVCMELKDQSGSERGVEIESSEGGVIKVFPRVEVRTVERFE